MDSSRLRPALRERLTRAMRDRDRVTVAALRSAIAVLENAEAVPTEDRPGPTTSADIAGAAIGVGAAEAERLELSAAAERELVRGEIHELRDAVAVYERAGDSARSAAAERAAQVLESALAGA